MEINAASQPRRHTGSTKSAEPEMAPPKRKVVRRDPEKRRLQNLQAQKKYREKVRRRLDTLETLAASIQDHQQDKQPLPAAAAAVISTTTQLPAQQSSEEAALEDFSAWDSQTFIDPSSLFLSPPSTSKSTSTTIDLTAPTQQWFTSTIDCGCTTRHVEVVVLQLSSPSEDSPLPSSSLAWKPNSVRLLRINTCPTTSNRLADPYRNHLRLESHCTIAAMGSNARLLGLSDEMLCDDDSISLFYRGGNSTSNLSVVKALFRSLKPDLRPTRMQITTLHHPCVDVFPFPTMRDNIIALGEAFDDYELCQDMMMAGGVVCWGGGMSAPWEARSWEAKPWFLRKYWALLGGEEGELARQSAWWRAMRGDEEEVWPGGMMPLS